MSVMSSWLGREDDFVLEHCCGSTRQELKFVQEMDSQVFLRLQILSTVLCDNQAPGTQLRNVTRTLPSKTLYVGKIAEKTA